MSGVVFEVRDGSAHREAGGRRFYFCCESCASYFAQHQARVLSARGIAP